MSVDLGQVITALLTFLVTGGGAGLVALAIKVRDRRRDEAEAAASGVAPGTGRRLDVSALATTLAEEAVAGARQRVADFQADAAAARARAEAADRRADAAEASAGRARDDADDSRRIAELVLRRLSRAEQHIRDTEAAHAAGLPTPPWPPTDDDAPLDVLVLRERRHEDVDHEGAERRAT